MGESTEVRAHRSVSQINQYERCPYSYKLQRVDKAWQRPAAWLAQGSAVHSVAEHVWRRKLAGNPMSLEEAHELFREQYSKEVSEYTEITPNWDFWFASGPYRGAADVERRYNIGLEQVTKFLTWIDNHPEEMIWIAPDGTPAIELPFDIDLDGVLVRGYIDAVLCGWDGPTVRDYKTGNSPGDDFQLAVYAVALAELYDIPPPKFGDYWMGRSGKPTLPYDLSYWTRERVSARFRELEENVQAQRFPPLPSADKCRFCSVASACDYREN